MKSMKQAILLPAMLLLFAWSCDRNIDKSDAYGNFEATEIIVSARAMGELVQLDLEEGDLLEKDEVVAVIDTVELSLSRKLLLQQKKATGAQLESIHSEIDVAKQRLQNSLVDQQRIQNLYRQGAATRKQLDDINGLVDVNRKQIDAIQSRESAIRDQMTAVDIQVEQIEDRIDKCLVRNPARGTVLVKYAERGELATTGKPIYKLADLERMKLKAYISGAQIPHVVIGQEVEVIIDDGEEEVRKLQGQVEWISSTAEFTPKTIQTREERVNLVYAIKVAVDNDGSIKIGMPGECNFVK